MVVDQSYVWMLATLKGKYGNDDMFPIAYAVAEAETRASWEWL
jgi:hypothetical protein